MKKEISVEDLLELIPMVNKDVTKKYVFWSKFNPEDFTNLQIVGVLKSSNPHAEEFPSKESYWSPNYPFALDYFPNNGSEIHLENGKYYLIYKDFGGHVPETRCRLINASLII